MPKSFYPKDSINQQKGNLRWKKYCEICRHLSLRIAERRRPSSMFPQSSSRWTLVRWEASHLSRGIYAGTRLTAHNPTSCLSITTSSENTFTSFSLRVNEQGEKINDGIEKRRSKRITDASGTKIRTVPSTPTQEQVLQKASRENRSMSPWRIEKQR